MATTHTSNVLEDDGQSCHTEKSPPTPDTSVCSTQRDEIAAVRHSSKQETRLIRFWRVVVALAHMTVATSVTIVTYRFLKDAEQETFTTAFAQFAASVAAAAYRNQADARDACSGLAESVTTSALAMNATWPFFTMPYFETRANQARKHSKAEFFAIVNMVPVKDYDEWNLYSLANAESFVKESHMLHSGNLDRLEEVNFTPHIFGGPPPNNATDDYEYAVVWGSSPPHANYGLVNYDARGTPVYNDIITSAIALKEETVITGSDGFDVVIGSVMTQEEHETLHNHLRESNTSYPHITVAHPVHERLGDPDSKVVAIVSALLAFDVALQDLLPPGIHVTAVVKNTCHQTFTYEIIGPEAVFKGDGDLHEVEYGRHGVELDLFEGLYNNPEFLTTPGHCLYSMSIYPNGNLHRVYTDKTPEVYAAILATTFALVAVVFSVYDVFVQRRNEKMVASAARTNAVVTSLFPGQYRDQMVNQVMGALDPTDGGHTFKNHQHTHSKPLADLFLDCTVLFADVSGFTAWCSVREPHQVFTLLEAVYGAFDKIARRRRVFKVETVGDCYVAATGLPTPRDDHALVMCRFARDIVRKMDSLTKELIVVLGPDTGDLTVRVGIHSGPVTAGVLRGERARFQLFGDTMNTTSRMENTGLPGHIQVSKATATLLTEAGKESWLEKRKDKILAKGKGELETYWLTKSDAVMSQSLHHRQSDIPKSDEEAVETASEDMVAVRPMVTYGVPTASSMDSQFDERISGLIDWNTEVLGCLLCAVVAGRTKSPNGEATINLDAVTEQEPTSSNFLDEVVEVIHLPKFNEETAQQVVRPESIKLPQQVLHQLRHYVATIASMYRENPFHNFEHASHVMMSVNKLMSRIVAPSPVLLDNHNEETGKASQEVKVAASTLHDHTYGITSDPLTQFACAVSALVHDVDHQGVPNSQLVNEQDEVAALYDNRSPAEQNSLELAWVLLMEETYADLRATIYASMDERQRFRQLLVNSVMATDVFDADLKAVRNAKWEKAFKDDVAEDDDTTDRKATIVIEHLIQASDVSHTMQHWHVYRKWNEKLFRESYKAYRNGRSSTDPSVKWYKGEIGFLDFYVIPLAKKLKECGVFGKSSGEFLNYARENRSEWEERGEEIVQSMLKSVETEYCDGGIVRTT